uniref:DUF4216 domain-containing protein n=1 Tax=Rhabditophanes sp. KR3021 TaxID=114890 RepID=A0AC35TWE2_9BILA
MYVDKAYKLKELEMEFSYMDNPEKALIKLLSGFKSTTVGTIQQQCHNKTQLEHILLRPDIYIGCVEDTVNNKIRSCKFLACTTFLMKSWMHKAEKMYVPEMVFGTLLTSLNYNDDQKKNTVGRKDYGDVRAYDIAGTTKGVWVFLNSHLFDISNFKDYVMKYLPDPTAGLVYEKVNDRWEVALSTSTKTPFDVDCVKVQFEDYHSVETHNDQNILPVPPKRNELCRFVLGDHFKTK